MKIDEEAQAAKVEWKKEFRKGKLMKNMFANVCYLILSIFIIIAFIAIMMDIFDTYDTLVQEKRDEIVRCGDDWRDNKCNDPVPKLREWCAE